MATAKYHFCLRASWALVLQLFVVWTSALVHAAALAAEVQIFNRRDLDGWSGAAAYWKVEGQQIIGKASQHIDRNEFLWNETLVKDFYLSVWVKLTPDDRNSGIQFRSKKKVPPTEACGYQADIGKTFWGRLYHESGRGKLVWSDVGEKSVRPNQWNHYEILAVGHRIWIALNGKLAVAIEDVAGEREGHIALQIHSGPPQEVRFKKFKLLHNPRIALVGLSQKELIHRLKQPDQR